MYTWINMYVCIYVYTYKHVCMYTCIHLYANIPIYLYMYTCIRTVHWGPQAHQGVGPARLIWISSCIMGGAFIGLVRPCDILHVDITQPQSCFGSIIPGHSNKVNPNLKLDKMVVDFIHILVQITISFPLNLLVPPSLPLCMCTPYQKKTTAFDSRS